MSLITPDTQITLINSLANLGSANPNDLLLIQRDLRSFRYRYSDLVNNLPDGNSLEVSGNKLKIKDDGIETSMIQDRSVSLGKIQNISQNRVLGRTASGSGVVDQISINTGNLNDSNNTLAVESTIKDYVDGAINSFISYTFTYGTNITVTSGFSWQVAFFNETRNYFDVFPPSGKTMNDLVAFIPSISRIHFSGNVDGNDSLRCDWAIVDSNSRIRVWVQNTEQRAAPAANYLAVWS